MAERALGAVLAPWLSSFALRPDADGPVLVACSGGADSLALLALAAATGHRAVAVHVDHGLRPGSAAEAGVVAAAAARVGARFVPARVEVEPGPGLEARARAERYAALDAHADAVGASAILLGHTRDDQAETVLLNLLRGAATSGLSGMPPTRGRLVRPILHLSRADTVEICARLRVAPVLDPMNDDVRFRRVWLRREVLPLLEAGTGRDLRPLLARQAGILRAESVYINGVAAEALARAGVSPGSPLATSVLCSLDPVIARRAVRVWLGPGPPSHAEVEEVLAVARGEVRAVQLAGGREVRRSRGVLRVGASAPGSGELPLPGAASCGRVQVETWVERGAPVRWPDGAWTAVLDADAAGDRAVLRVAGGAGDRAANGDAEDVVVTDPAGATLWEVGYRVATRARVTPATRRYLWARATIDERERV